MRRLPSRSLLVLFVLTLGCNRSIEAENRAEQEANTKKVTADSTDDATEPIVDEDFSFRLELPASGWKLLREQDATRLNPDAVAGAMNTNGAGYGIVIVERLPGTTLEQAAAMLWHDGPPGLEVESEVDLEFQGIPAKRRVFTAKIEGYAFRYMTTIFMRQDHLYQVMSWSQNLGDSVVLTTFQDAFKLLDGEVKDRSLVREAVTHADGVGWRIRDSRFESALSSLCLRRPEGWRFMVGAELERLGSDAEIVLVHEAYNSFLALIPERASQDRLEALAALSRKNFLAGKPPVGEPFTRELAGQSVEFRRYEQAPLDFIQGVYVGDESITAVAAWYPQAFAEDASAAIDAVFAKLEAVPASERAKLHDELLGAPTSQRRFTANRAYRAGEFLDFENQLRWTKPPGFWHVENFDKALDHSKETVLFAVEAEFGVYAALEVFNANGVEPTAVIDNMFAGNEFRSRDTVEVDGLTIHRAHTIDRSQNPALSHAIAITRRDNRMISLLAWAIDESPGAQAAMDAALAGLDYDPKLERTTVAGGKYTDVRYGFSFDIPKGFAGSPQITDLVLGQSAAWTKANEALAAIVVSEANTNDEEWLSSFFEQILRDRVGAEHALGKPERSEGKLGAHAARRLTWHQGREELIADIVVRDNLIYCILYANLSKAQHDTVRNSWALLE